MTSENDHVTKLSEMIFDQTQEIEELKKQLADTLVQLEAIREETEYDWDSECDLLISNIRQHLPEPKPKRTAEERNADGLKILDALHKVEDHVTPGAWSWNTLLDQMKEALSDDG